MKTILRFLAIGFTALGGLSSTATAGHWHVGVVVGTSVSRYLSCGCPVYSQRYISYIDPYGYPVYDYRVLAVNHVCRPVVPLYLPPPVYVPSVRVVERARFVPWDRGGFHGGPVMPSPHRHGDWHW